LEVKGLTNREAHEEAAGMALEPLFFALNKIAPDAEYCEEWAETGLRVKSEIMR